MAPWTTWDRQLTLSVSCVRYAKIKATNPTSELPLTCFCSVAENLLCQVRLYIGSWRQDANKDDNSLIVDVYLGLDLLQIPPNLK